MVYGAVRVGADIIGAAVFSLGISVAALVTTCVRLGRDFRCRTAWAPYNRSYALSKKRQPEPDRGGTAVKFTNRRNSLPGLRRAVQGCPAAVRREALESYYSVCTELALPRPRVRSIHGNVTVRERVLCGFPGRPGQALRFGTCRATVVRHPAVQLL